MPTGRLQKLLVSNSLTMFTTQMPKTMNLKTFFLFDNNRKYNWAIVSVAQHGTKTDSFDNRPHSTCYIYWCPILRSRANAQKIHGSIIKWDSFLLFSKLTAIMRLLLTQRQKAQTQKNKSHTIKAHRQ